MEALENPLEQPAPETALETASETTPEEVTAVDFETLMAQHAQLERRQRQKPASLSLTEVETLVTALRELLPLTTDAEQRQALEAAQRRWTAFLELQRAMASTRRGGIPVWALMLITVTGMLALSLGVTWMLRRDTTPAAPTQLSLVEQTTPTAGLPEGLVQPGVPELEALPTPTPAFLVLPTATLAPTPDVTAEAPAETTPEPPPLPHSDPGGDVTPLVGGAAISAPPAGVDIASCNIAADTTVLQTTLPPFTVEGAGDENRLVLWLTLQTPAPAQRTLTYHWLLALDVDGNPNTGRPTGAGYINPELGTEVGAGVFLYPDGRLEPYLYIWDRAQGDWASGARVPDILQVTLTEGRDALAFSLPVAELSAAIQEITGVAFDATALKGRVGAIASSQTVAAVVDFCPDRP